MNNASGITAVMVPKSWVKSFKTVGEVGEVGVYVIIDLRRANIETSHACQRLVECDVGGHDVVVKTSHDLPRHLREGM